MRQFIHKSSKLALYSVCASVVFALLALFVPEYILTPAMNAICVGIVGTVTIVFLPLIIRSLKDKSFDKVSQLMIGMLLMWLSLLGSRFTWLYVDITGNAGNVAHSPVIPFLAYLAILGGILHITSPGVVGTEWRDNKNLLICGVSIGLILALSVIFIHGHYFPG